MTISSNKRKAIGSREVTCSAPVNIAVIKYWGKRNKNLLLPTNSSLSLTLSQDDLRSVTTIRITPDELSTSAQSSQAAETFFLNGLKQDHGAKRLQNVVSQARKARKVMEKEEKSLEKISDWPMVIASVNNFPTAAGLASSASGFACLTFALAEIFELTMSMPEISRIARMGSGSACRSLFGGYVKWEMGEMDDGSDSMAIQVASEQEWPDIEALVLVVSDARKDVGSTEGMQETVETSSLLQQRINSVVPARMMEMEEAIKKKDFDRFAELTMMDSNQFHAVCLDTFPPIFYMNDISRAIIRVITAYNSLFLSSSEGAGSREGIAGMKKGYQVCYTYDAGPNAVLYMPKENIAQVLGLIDHYFPTSSVIAGSGASDYFGRARQFLGNVDKAALKMATDQIGIEPWPVDSLKRIISTTVGDGPRVLSTSADEFSLLNKDDNFPKTHHP